MSLLQALGGLQLRLTEAWQSSAALILAFAVSACSIRDRKSTLLLES